MKPALLSLSFILFALTTTVHAEKVLDWGGRPVTSQDRYYYMPAMFGPPGGGLSLDTTENSTCPVTIMQNAQETWYGLAVQFTPLIGIDPPGNGFYVYTGTPLEIAFNDSYVSICAESSKWVVVEDDDGDYPRKYWIGVGGAKDHPGKKILSGTFNFQSSHDWGGYKLVFCTIDACFDVARHEDDDHPGRRLILKTSEYDAYFNVKVLNVNSNVTESFT